MACPPLKIGLAAALTVAGCTHEPLSEVMTTTVGDTSDSSGGSQGPGDGSTGPDATPGSGGATDDTGGTGDTGGSEETGSGSTGPECVDEICNGIDDDCDDEIDEGCDCVDGQEESCYGGPPGTQGMGECAAGSRSCADGAWGACSGEALPTDETCNGLDDDCDGMPDEELGQLSCGLGICMVTVDSCVGGVEQPCMPGPPQVETCNGVDDDCDGVVDNGCCSQIVVGGGFEAGTPNPDWAEASTNFGTPLCTAGCGGGTSHGGSWWAWFGGFDGYDLASVGQDLVIPSGTATLRFWLRIAACASTVEDTLTVSIDGTPVSAFDNGDASCGAMSYTQHMIDVSAFADGGLHTLTVVGEVFGSGPPASSITNFWFDDVSIEVCI